jgi:hypothetical protein
MDRLAESSFFDYGKWYLEREERKGHRLDRSIPPTAEEMQRYFEATCRGKYRDWFPRGRWSVGRLTFDEFKRLMVVDAAEARREQLVIERIPRTLSNAAKNAIATGYFEILRTKREKHFWYYLSYIYGSLSLSGENRLVVCSLSGDEKHGSPEGTYSYYLHDGWGRALPYMTLLLRSRLEYQPVEVFYAENV